MVRKADARLWRTADDRIVEEGDPDARTLWKAEGDEITADEDKRYKLGGSALKAATPRNAEAVDASEFDDDADAKAAGDAPDEDKAADQGGNKSRARAADKSA